MESDIDWHPRLARRRLIVVKALDDEGNPISGSTAVLGGRSGLGPPELHRIPI